MNAIRIRRKLESETLHLPELKPLVGKNVEIVVKEQPTPSVVPGTGDWETAARAAEQLRKSGYDFDAFRKQREYGLKHALMWQAKEHL
jgi:hypothetical protein